MAVLSTLEPKKGSYSAVLLATNGNLLFTGTSNGLVEVWDLSDQTKRAELRYLVLDTFGEPTPIEDRVVTLAAPDDFSLVYAFMGNAAYCIDVELLTIVEKVPISEEVISGNIAPNTGEIGVISLSGYLSRWSPEFVERVSSMDLPFSTPSCYLLHDVEEHRVILVFETGKLIIAALDDNPYTLELNFPEAANLVNGIWYDRNNMYQVIITDLGTIKIYNLDTDISEIDSDHILVNGKLGAEQVIREYIIDQPITEEDREYIKDFRLARQSRDRYVAEVEKLQEDPHYISSLEEDSKTLHFALYETQSEDIDSKTKAYSVIKKVSSRHNINPKFVFFAKKQSANANEIIERARFYEFESERRQQRIKWIAIISLLLSLVILLIAELITFTLATIAPYLLSILVLLFIMYYWKNLNTNPHMPTVTEYRAIRLTTSLAVVIALILVFLNSFSEVLPFKN